MAMLDDVPVSGMDLDDQDGSLEYLISIWPISSKVATHLPVGDLISLSRSSKALRAHTHGFGSDFHLSSNSPNLHLGEHQTQYWANLKALSPFICSFPSHKEPKSAKSNPCHACKFCSRPICKTCIVRSFFTDPKSSKLTYKYRARHLCRKCWDTGNLRKDYRFPADRVSREQIWQGRGYAQRGNWCGCSASEDNWVCGECRVLQNTSGVLNEVVSVVPIDNGKIPQESGSQTGELVAVTCYGLDCDVTITEADRDRRRVCLWCSKPLMRPYGGDDRLRWEEKQIEIRAAAAASRSADIYEWARNRFKSLTMSRREMRGTEACIELTGSDGPEHDQPMFVRHLDTINYRKYMNQNSAPSGDEVYQSKHGRWVYSRAFLSRFNRATQYSSQSRAFVLPPDLNLKELFLLNADMGLPGSRVNSHPHFRSELNGPCQTLLRYGAQLQNAELLDQDSLSWLHLVSHESVSGMENLKSRLFEYLSIWEDLSEERQIGWTPPSFWFIAGQMGVLKKKEKDAKKRSEAEGVQDTHPDSEHDSNDDDKKEAHDGQIPNGSAESGDDDQEDIDDKPTKYDRSSTNSDLKTTFETEDEDICKLKETTSQNMTHLSRPHTWQRDIPSEIERNNQPNQSIESDLEHDSDNENETNMDDDRPTYPG